MAAAHLEMSSWEEILGFHFPYPASLRQLPGGTSTAIYSCANPPTIPVPDMAIFDETDSILARATEALQRGLETLPKTQADLDANPFPKTRVSMYIGDYALKAQDAITEEECSWAAVHLCDIVAVLVQTLYTIHRISSTVKCVQPPLEYSQKGDRNILVLPENPLSPANTTAIEEKKPSVLNYHWRDLGTGLVLKGTECSGIEAVLFKVRQALCQYTFHS
jgi:hypothetical protein